MIAPDRRASSRTQAAAATALRQADKVGRRDIDAFEAVTGREGEGGRQRDFIVAFGYTRS